ncbi:MAG TPA: PHP domain-containing protein [Thermotogota bacterium]|nr:PHP domain-containing protein [Thermotogota bacterium]
MLNVKSCFSISKSTVKINEYVDICAEKGFDFAAICDENFYGLPDFLKACREKSLKAVFGISDKNDLNFFIMNRNGYELLLRYKNGILESDVLLRSKDIFTVYSGTVDRFKELKKKYSNTYFGSDSLNTLNEGMEDTVFFKEINTLSDSDSDALRLIQWIGKIPAGEKQAGFSFQAFLQLLYDNSSNPLFNNINEVIRRVEPYDLKFDYRIPVLNDSGKSDDDILLSLTENAFNARYHPEDKDYSIYRERYRKEFRIISEKGFSRYLLLACEIVKTARGIGAIVGPGRGSAVSSLLVNLLGITSPDPVKFNLMFERFLSEDREDEPDIDIDIDDQMRPELLKMLNKKYGKSHMVHVITFGTYGEKLVRREIGKYIADDAVPLNSGKYDELTERVLGLPHHISTHAAGIIFSEDDLRTKIPLQQMNELFFMTQYDMDSLKECGIFKMDILGLITLSVLKEMDTANGNTDFSLYNVNPDENEVIESLKKDNIKGIFQLDSKSGRFLAEKFTPRNFDEIRVMISLNRPGPSQSGLTDEWINRRNGAKDVEYYHPLVKEILSETYGVPVFQEQIMEMSMRLGGFSPKQANDFRKAMAKKDPDQMKRHEMAFINGCLEHDMDSDEAIDLFNMMYEFAGYAFNKAHATAYSFITYWTLFAKYYFPHSFYKVMIDSNHGKSEKLFEIINEAVKNGIPVFPPDINKSEYLTMVESGGLRLGFHTVREFPRNAAEKIIAEREKGFFRSAEDFVCRIDEKTVSDKLLQRCVWANLFRDMEGNANFKEMVFFRNKNKKALKKIGARLFGEVTESDNPIKDNQSNSGKTISEEVLDELSSYGFIAEYERFFNIRYNPFMNSTLNLGIVVSEEQKNRYRISTGYDVENIISNYRLKEGEYILFQRKKNITHLNGFYLPEIRAIELSGASYSEIESELSKDIQHIKISGIRVLKIKTAKGIMEVLL